MGAILSLSDLVNRMTGGSSGTPQNVFFHKAITVASVADSWTANIGWYSFFRYDGFPGGAATPTTVAALTSATAGAIPFTNPGGGRQKWLVQATVAANAPTSLATILLYDRLVHIGGLDATVTTPQTVGGTITRYTTGDGNRIFVEIFVAPGTTTGRTISAEYTNQAGDTNRVTVGVPFGGAASTAGNDANLFIELPLQAGDTGVRSVQTVTVSATTGTAGNFGVVITHPLAHLPAYQGQGFGRDFTAGPTGMPEIMSDACLALAGWVTATTETAFVGVLATVEA